MRNTTNYNMIICEGTDLVNPLTQIFPNFEIIDTAMKANKEGGVTIASEVTTGGVHAIVRTDATIPMFRYTATSSWTTGDTMTLDGSAVTVHLTDGTTPKSGDYVIGAEVIGVVNGSLVTLLTSKTFDGVVSFNSRQGVVVPGAGDYSANMIGYNNTVSGLVATESQSAIDEVNAKADSIRGVKIAQISVTTVTGGVVFVNKSDYPHILNVVPTNAAAGALISQASPTQWGIFFKNASDMSPVGANTTINVDVYYCD